MKTNQFSYYLPSFLGNFFLTLSLFLSKKILRILIKINLEHLMFYIYDLFVHVTKTNKIGKKKTIFVLSAHRIKTELSVFLKSGYDIVHINPRLQYHLIGIFFDNKKIKPYDYYNSKSTQSIKAYEKWNYFAKNFLSFLNSKYNIDAIISPNLHYKVDYVWGSTSLKLLNTPYIIFTFEDFVDSEFEKDKWKVFFYNVKKFHVTHVFLQSDEFKKIIINSKVNLSNKISVIGTLRMENFVKKIKKNPICPKKKTITFFTYWYRFSGSGNFASEKIKNKLLTTIVNESKKLDLLFSCNNENGFFVESFYKTICEIGKFAVNNPNINCIIKYRDGRDNWQINFIKKTLKRNNINLENTKNLILEGKANVHDLIFKSHIVCGYGSTTLLESSVAGKYVIVPFFFHKKIEKKYNKFLLQTFLNNPKVFKVIRETKRFYNELETIKYKRKIKNKNISLAKKIFEKYISPFNSSPRINCLKIMEKIIN